MAADENQSQERSDQWSKEQGQKSSFCVTDGSLSSWEFGAGTSIPEVQRTGCTPRWHCKRWFWFVRSVHWTRIISNSNDSRKSHGYQIKRSRMFRTNGGCSIRWNSGQHGWCINVTKNSKVRMPRHLDASTTTQMAQIMVQYGRPSCSSWKESVRSSFGRTIVVGKAIWEISFGKRLGKSFKLGMFLCQPSKRTILVSVRGRCQIGRQDRKHRSDPENSHERRRSGRTNIISWPCVFGCSRTECHVSKDIVAHYRDIFGDFYGSQGKATTRAMDDHQFKEEENESVGESSTVCSQIVLRCLCLARIWRPDISWSVNKLVRAVTKWTKTCDKRLARLISYIHHINDDRQYCYVGNTAQHCRQGLFQDLDFADFEDSKSTSGGILCIFGSHLCQ